MFEKDNLINLIVLLIVISTICAIIITAMIGSAQGWFVPVVPLFPEEINMKIIKLLGDWILLVVVAILIWVFK